MIYSKLNIELVLGHSEAHFMLMHLECSDADMVDIPGAELPVKFLHPQLFQVLHKFGQYKQWKKSANHLNEKFPQFEDVVSCEACSAFHNNCATSKQLGLNGSPGIIFMT